MIVCLLRVHVWTLFFSKHCFCIGVQLLHSSCRSVATFCISGIFYSRSTLSKWKTMRCFASRVPSFVKIGSRCEGEPFASPRASFLTDRRCLQVVRQEWMFQAVRQDVCGICDYAQPSARWGQALWGVKERSQIGTSRNAGVRQRDQYRDSSPWQWSGVRCLLPLEWAIVKLGQGGWQAFGVCSPLHTTRELEVLMIRY